MNKKERKYYFDKLKEHSGHSICIATYGRTSLSEDVESLSIECLDCNEVLIDFENE
jgi:hypothetical protein